MQNYSVSDMVGQTCDRNRLGEIMISSKQKIILDKTSLINIAVDLLLSVLVGSAISLLIFLGFYGLNGASDLMEIFIMYFFLIFVNSPYSMLFRLVILVPIYVPIFSILVTRGLVQKVSSRKSWILPVFVVAVTSAVVAVTLTIVGLLFLGYGGVETYVMAFSIGLLFIFLGFLMGMFLGLIFAPMRRIFKILVAVITSTIVGGFFEIAFLIYITQQ
jgi:hypothetical protein